MKFLNLDIINADHKEELFHLWNDEYPLELRFENHVEFDAYLDKLEFQNHILLLDDKGSIQGWYSDFIRDKERWFLVILATEFQGKKWGTKLLELGRQERAELNGWIITANTYKKFNGQAYRSPGNFYRKMGFSLFQDVKLEGEKITAIKIKWSNTDPKWQKRKQ